MTPCDFSELVGKTLVEIDGAEEDSDEIVFTCSDGSKYLMYHEQECCEEVLVSDICGDIDCLIGNKILKAEVSSRHEEHPDDSISVTWTFYNLATVKGYVTIRWYGGSNGYYSERVTLAKLEH